MNREYLYERKLTQPIHAIEVPGAVIRKTNETEIALLREVWPVDLNRAVSRLERGDLCYFGFINDRVASYHWMQTSGMHFLQQAGKHYQVQPGEGWIYHVRVAEWARGLGLNTAVYSRMLLDAKSEGINSVWVYTNARNKANQRGLEKNGFLHVKTLLSVRLGRTYFLIK